MRYRTKWTGTRWVVLVMGVEVRSFPTLLEAENWCTGFGRRDEVAS